MSCAGSSTEAEFIAAVSAAKAARYIRMILHDLQIPETKPTPIYEDNESAIKIINQKIPTPRLQHVEIKIFVIQEWIADLSITMKHIPGIFICADALTKPNGWVLHERHVRRFMGHFYP